MHVYTCGHREIPPIIFQVDKIDLIETYQIQFVLDSIKKGALAHFQGYSFLYATQLVEFIDVRMALVASRVVAQRL